MRPKAELGETALKQVEALGFAAADVKQIVTTHLDPDHSGGLPDFPEAEVHIFGRELDAALEPAPARPAALPRLPLAAQPASGSGTTSKATSWFGFEGVRILPDLGTEVLLVPLRRALAGPHRRRDQDRRGLAAALRRRLLPPRRGRHPALLPTGPAPLPEPQQRRPAPAPGQPGAAARAGRAPRRRGAAGLLARPARAGPGAGGQPAPRRRERARRPRSSGSRQPSWSSARACASTWAGWRPSAACASPTTTSSGAGR